MLEALWSLTFSVGGVPASGGGVIVVENGRILGGDMCFTYVGDIHVDKDQVKAKVRVKRYQQIPGIVSLIGIDDYYGIFEGKVDPNKMHMKGYVEGKPNLKYDVFLTRRAELP